MRGSRVFIPHVSAIFSESRPTLLRFEWTVESGQHSVLELLPLKPSTGERIRISSTLHRHHLIGASPISFKMEWKNGPGEYSVWRLMPLKPSTGEDDCPSSLVTARSIGWDTEPILSRYNLNHLHLTGNYAAVSKYRAED